MPMFVAAIPGNFLVDHLPILKRIPEWIPGTFKHHAKDWKEWALTMLNEPYADAKKIIVRSFFLFPCAFAHMESMQQESGNFEPSFIADSLESLDPKSKDFEKQEYIIKSVAGTMFTGKSSDIFHLDDTISNAVTLPAGADTVCITTL